MMNDYRPYIIDIRNIKKRIRVYHDYIKRHRHDIDDYNHIINNIYNDISNSSNDAILDNFARNLNNTRSMVRDIKCGVDNNVNRLKSLSSSDDEDALSELLSEYEKFNESVDDILNNIVFMLNDDNIKKSVNIRSNADFINKLNHFCNNACIIDDISLGYIISNINYDKLKILRLKIMNNSHKIVNLLRSIDNRLREYEHESKINSN